MKGSATVTFGGAGAYCSPHFCGDFELNSFTGTPGPQEQKKNGRKVFRYKVWSCQEALSSHHCWKAWENHIEQDEVPHSNIFQELSIIESFASSSSAVNLFQFVATWNKWHTKRKDDSEINLLSRRWTPSSDDIKRNQRERNTILYFEKNATMDLRFEDFFINWSSPRKLKLDENYITGFSDMQLLLHSSHLFVFVICQN